MRAITFPLALCKKLSGLLNLLLSLFLSFQFILMDPIVYATTAPSTQPSTFQPEISTPKTEVEGEVQATNSKPQKVAEPSTLPATVFTLGGRTSEEDSAGFVDFLAPAVGSEDFFLFINPRATLSENSENEENVGLGLRKMILNDMAILGGNVFYDTRESSHDNRFNQLGLGIEFLTEWVDARANYYLPEDDREIIASQETQETQVTVQTSLSDPFFSENEVGQDGTTVTKTTTTTHHFDQFEEAMEGFDVEIGMKIPVVSRIAETRVFGGFYFYNSHFRENLQGPKARLEVRAVPGIIFDAEWFDDKELHGSDYYFGARVRLPFDIGNLFHGKNPFEGAREYFRRGPQPLKVRMTDMVMRDIDIIIEESEFIEDLNRLKVETEVEVVEFHITLLDDITFVDADNFGLENGTFEHPFNTIQEGVNSAFGDKFVHVSDAASNYNENVVLTENVTLWGSGCVIFGPESGIRPTVDGRSFGPSITMADNTHVWGFHVINTDLGGPAIISPVTGTDIRRVGIYSENKTNLDISCHNLIENNEIGVLLEADSIPSFVTSIQENTIQNNDQQGLMIFGQGSGGSFSTVVENNQIINNGSQGAFIQALNYDAITTRVNDNIVNNNSLDNIFMSLSTNDGNIDVEINRNQVSDSVNGSGISATMFAGGIGDLLARVNDNIANNNSFTNISAFLGALNGDVDVEINRNQVNGSINGGGIVSSILSAGNVLARVNDNIANNNNIDNISPFISSFNGDVDVEINRNQANGSINGGGIVSFIGGAGNVLSRVNDNIANNNFFDNIFATMNSSSGGVDAQINRNQASSSVTGQGIFAPVTAGGTGAILVRINDNIANNNFSNNIFAPLSTSDGDIDAEINRNQVSDSVNGQGIFVPMSAGGIGDILARVNDNVANNNFAINIFAPIGTGGDVDAEFNRNQASGALIGQGIFSPVTSGSGNILVRVNDNVANGNAGDNIFASQTATNGDIDVEINRNQASGSTGDNGIFAVMISGGTGGILARINDNIANNNFSSNLFIPMEVSNGVDVEVNRNQASSALNDQGIFLSMSGGTGDVLARVNDNIANNNFSRNIFVNMSTSDGDMDVEINRNQASGSADGNGIFASMSTGGTGDILARVNDNIANNNSSTNLSTPLNTSNGDIDAEINRNQASNSVNGQGIFAPMSAGGIGDILARMNDNIANNNASHNIFAPLSTIDGDLDVEINRNQASDSVNGRGIFATIVAGGSGDILARMNDNIANNNSSINIFIPLITSDGDIGVEINRNQASDSVSGEGLFSFMNAGGAGDILARVNDNIANNNILDNITTFLNTFNGDIDVEINRNQASGSINGRGISSLNAMTAGGTGSILARVNDNLANNNFKENLFVPMTTNNGNIDVEINRNQVSDSTGEEGIFSPITAGGTGGVFARINDNIVNNNFFENISSPIVARGNIDAEINRNQASNSTNGQGIFAPMLVFGSGDILARVNDNIANNNSSTNLSTALSTGGDIDAEINRNQASSSTNGEGISSPITSGTGLILARVNDNIANNNFSNNILSPMVTGAVAGITIDAQINENQASGSTNGHGIFTLMSSGGAVTAELNENTANDNHFQGIDASLSGGNGISFEMNENIANLNDEEGILLSASGGFISAFVNDNTANENLLQGIDASFNSGGTISFEMNGNNANLNDNEGVLVSASTSGPIDANVNDNTANDNVFQGINASFSSSASGVIFDMNGNTASLNDSQGILVNASSAGLLDAQVNNNIANGNSAQNIFADLFASDDIDITVSSNQANGSGSLGMEINARISFGATGDVTAVITGNNVNLNNFENIKATLESRSGNIDLTYNSNTTNGSVNSPGVSLNANVVSGNGDILAQINDNTSNSNQGSNIFAGLTANNGNIDFEMQRNTANDSVTGFGFQLPLTVNGSGNINALMVSNTATGNSILGFIPELKAPGDVTLTLTSNVANLNGAHGMEIKINEGAVVGTNVNVFVEQNVVKSNGNDGIRLFVDSGSASYDIDFGGGTLGSLGNNSFTNNGNAAGEFDLHDVSPLIGALTIFAQSNFWNDPDPLVDPEAGEEYQSDNGNTIDVSNHLTSDPNP